MQYKGVSCGPLSFIHAAACELPAWQTCRRVLWHPVESYSHSSIRGSQSRAGAHLHKKYMDTLLTYVTVTTNVFLLWLWKLSYFKQDFTANLHTTSILTIIMGLFATNHLGHSYQAVVANTLYLWSISVCLCAVHGLIGMYMLHTVAPVVPC